MSTNVRKTLVIASMGAALASPAMAQQQTAAPATTTPIAAPAAPDPAAVQRVVEAINAAIAAQPATATAQDIEAAVMVAVSQQQQPAAVSLAALTFVGGILLVSLALGFAMRQRGSATRRSKNWTGSPTE